MSGMTWDMTTSGPDAGKLTRPLAYTIDEDQATRVKVFLQLATPLGTNRYKDKDGLDHARILDSTTSDAERGELVRDVILADERAERMDDEPSVVTELDASPGPRVTITASFFTITGVEITIGAGIGA